MKSAGGFQQGAEDRPPVAGGGGGERRSGGCGGGARADQGGGQARQLRAGPGGQRGPRSLVQFLHGEAAVGGGRAQDVHGGVPVGVRCPLLRRAERRARAETLVEKGRHQTAARRMVAWPPARSRTVSAATRPVKPRAVKLAEPPPAADPKCQCSKAATRAPATTTSTCTAINASVPSPPHRLFTAPCPIPYTHTANRPTAEVSQVAYHGPFSRYVTRKKCRDSPQPPVDRSIACSAVSTRADTRASAIPSSAVPE